MVVLLKVVLMVLLLKLKLKFEIADLICKGGLAFTKMSESFRQMSHSIYYGLTWCQK